MQLSAAQRAGAACSATARSASRTCRRAPSERKTVSCPARLQLPATAHARARAGREQATRPVFLAPSARWREPHRSSPGQADSPTDAGSATIARRSSRLSSRRVAARPTSAKPTPTQKARLYPRVAASTCGTPAVSRWSVRVVDDRRQDRQPERAADLLARVDQARLQARPRAEVAPASAAIETGTKEKPSPMPMRMKPTKQVCEVGAVDGDLGEVDEPGREHDHPGGEHRLHADPRHQRLGHAGGDDRGQRDREVADAGLDRREAEHLLHVEGEQEEHPEHHRRRARSRPRSPR